MAITPKLQRTVFRTSRLLDFCSQKELVAQTGHQPAAWPLVVLKELVDNALDACEDEGIPPVVAVTVTPEGICVKDNGPGLPPEVVDGVLDYAVRVSSREAYVAPDRGAQGNALKTIVAMPFVLDGTQGQVHIEARGIRHQITMRIDRIRQEPILEPQKVSVEAAPGTKIAVFWPESASSLLHHARARFLQIAADYTFLNPHLSLSVAWFGEEMLRWQASDPSWKKWAPRDPTCPHWYGREHLERLVTAYITHDLDNGRRRTVREFVAEFRGLSSTIKQKAVLDEVGLSRTSLVDLANEDGLRTDLVCRLLAAMQRHCKPVRPSLLGPIGREHLRGRLEELGCEMETFKYESFNSAENPVPWVVEIAFAWCPALEERRLVTGVNWSPGIVNPFRELGMSGHSLDSVLEERRAGPDEPVCFFMHLIGSRVQYTDRGKSAVVLAD
jgi:DNA topoisomerase VI subunit B